MTTDMDDPTVWLPARVLEALDEARHVGHACAVCSDRDEGLGLAVELAAETLSAGGTCLAHGGAEWLDELAGLLALDGVDVASAAEGGALLLMPVRSGAVRPQDSVGAMRALGVGGFPDHGPLTGLLDMASLLGNDHSPQHVLEHEARIVTEMSRIPMRLVCIYDRDSFGPSAIKDAIYSHPLVVTEGQVRENHHFTPPEELLAPDRTELAVEGLLASLELPEPRAGVEAATQTADAYRRMETANSLLATEIGRRTLIERELRESEELFRVLFEASPESVFIHSGGKIVFANQAAADMVLAGRPQEVEGTAVLDFVHESSRASVIERVKWMLQTGRQAPQMEERFVRLDGSAFDAEVVAVPLTFRGAPAIQVIMRDVTDRKRAQEEREFRSFLLDRATDSIVVLDAESGRALYVNEAACRMRQRTREELLARPASDWVPAGQARQDAQRRATLKSEGRVIYETEITRKDGRGVPVEVHASLVEYLGRPVVVSVARDVEERKQAEATIQRMAFYDSLTGLANRTLFMDRLEMAVAQARRTATGLAVIFLDLDHFKSVNDTVGHGVGDELLAAVAGRLAAIVRAGDTVARLGGDEFTLLLPGVADEDQAGEVADKVLRSMLPPFELTDQEIHATASIGIALLGPADDPATMLKNADAAMYLAKEMGRNSYEIYDPAMRTVVLDRFELRNDLREALDRGEIEAHYQPILRVSDGRIVGAEALMRWTHPGRGPVDPMEFIPLAEETGLIVRLGEWILTAACEQCASWARDGLGEVRVSVNLSPRQVMHGALAETVAGVLERTGLPPHLLELEVTESVAMIGSRGVQTCLAALRELGVRIAIDDFGTGYSSLDYLRRYPISTLKVDRSFVSDLASDGHSRAIAANVVVLARTLALNVVAEGVETEDQLAFLSECDCHEAQGFLFSPAVSAEAFRALLREGGFGRG